MNGKTAKRFAVLVWIGLAIVCMMSDCDTVSGMAQAGQEETEDTDIHKKTQDLLSELGLSKIDAYLSQEEAGQLTFSQLVGELMQQGLTPGFAAVGEQLKQAVFADYEQNRSVLIQILTLSIA